MCVCVYISNSDVSRSYTQGSGVHAGLQRHEGVRSGVRPRQTVVHALQLRSRAAQYGEPRLQHKPRPQLSHSVEILLPR